MRGNNYICEFCGNGLHTEDALISCCKELRDQEAQTGSKGKRYWNKKGLVEGVPVKNFDAYRLDEAVKISGMHPDELKDIPFPPDWQQVLNEYILYATTEAYDIGYRDGLLSKKAKSGYNNPFRKQQEKQSV